MLKIYGDFQSLDDINYYIGYKCMLMRDFLIQLRFQNLMILLQYDLFFLVVSLIFKVLGEIM